jgi:hypothetical protein
LNSKPRTAYTVAIGPRGGGKSTAVEMAASKRNGTLSVTVTNHSTMYEIIAEAIRAAEFKAFGTESLRADGFNIETDAQLALVMQKAAELRTPHDPSWIPTLIVEVDQHATDGTVTNVAKMLKRLCVDHRAARVVLVLSDAIASFALPDDPSRQKIVWVEDLSEVEAQGARLPRQAPLPAGRPREPDGRGSQEGAAGRALRHCRDAGILPGKGG